MNLNKKAFFLVCIIATYTNLSFAKTSVDNSRINERDNKGQGLTADQQKSNASDAQITARIRQDIMKQKTFSTYAKNIKIISVNGKVTLKGPVRTEKEESQILQAARSIAGPSNVIDQIDIAPATY